MIKKMELSQLDKVMAIWLDANITAHPFIPAQYWVDHVEPVKGMLPQADIWVYEESGSIEGFIGIMPPSFIAGLFVAPASQSVGIGSRLMDYCKEHYEALHLDVYVQNEKAVRFYLKHGFEIQEKKISDSHQEPEYVMRWVKP